MRLIKKGAEANLYLSKFLGKKVIIKRRVGKSYRIKELDKKIISERISLEINLLHKAKLAGVLTPTIYAVLHNDIIMEYINGPTLKKYLENVNKKEALNLCYRFGKEIAKLHNASIIHGDLTTSNVILDNDNLIFFDFGLGYISQKDEDKATDLLVLKKIFLASHSNIRNGWKKILDGYSKKAKDLGKKIIEIEKRARYLK